MWHIIDRYVYHFGWAIVLTGGLSYLLYWLTGRYSFLGKWVSTRYTHLLFLSAWIIGTIMPIREGYDAIMGNQIWYKTPFDQASWYTGAAFGVWAFYRFEVWVQKRKSLGDVS